VIDHSQNFFTTGLVPVAQERDRIRTRSGSSKSEHRAARRSWVAGASPAMTEKI